MKGRYKNFFGGFCTPCGYRKEDFGSREVPKRKEYIVQVFIRVRRCRRDGKV